MEVKLWRRNAQNVMEQVAVNTVTEPASSFIPVMERRINLKIVVHRVKAAAPANFAAGRENGK